MEPPPEKPPLSSWVPLAQGVTFFGKVRTRADFVRIAHHYPAALALDGWLEKAVEDTLLAGASLPDRPAHFVFAAPGESWALLGLLVPGRDRVGRTFPTAIFAALPDWALAAALPCLESSCGPFLDRLHVLAAERDTLDIDALAERCAAVAPPSMADFSHAMQTPPPWQEAAPEAFHARVFGPAHADAAPLAYAALIDTVATLRQAERTVAKVIDCPIERAEDAAFWLSLHQALQPDPTPHTCFWSGDAGHLWIASRLAPVQSLRFLARPQTRHRQKVSLYGEQALAQGQDALQQAVRESVQESKTLQDLIVRLSAASQTAPKTP